MPVHEVLFAKVENDGRTIRRTWHLGFETVTSIAPGGPGSADVIEAPMVFQPRVRKDADGSTWTRVPRKTDPRRPKASVSKFKSPPSKKGTRGSGGELPPAA